MALQPKETFLKKYDQDLGPFRDMLHSARMLEASQVALLQFPLEIREKDAASAWHQMEGARKFLDTLLHIADMTRPVTTEPDPTQLNYDRNKRITHAST